jgi:hypothetical protein
MVTSFCLLCLIAGPVSADGPQFSLEGGESAMGTEFSARYLTPAAFGEVVWNERSIGSSQFTWAPDVIGGWIDGRDAIQDSVRNYTTRDHIWLIGAGARFHYGESQAWYHPLFFSFQPSLHTGRTPALSSSYEFTYTIGWQASHWLIGIRHSSNAYLHEPNRGESMALLGVTF